MSEDFLKSCGWESVYSERLSGREAQYFSASDLHLAPSTQLYLSHTVPSLYGHQRQAIQLYAQGHNVCLATGTASGKSLPFYVSALECIERNAGARILAIYPMKALAHEQYERWTKALAAAGSKIQIGMIDGEVKVSQRSDIIRHAQVLIVTPDIMHAWLLSNAGDKFVLSFLRSIRLIVVDEVHNYTGVFGSNSAFLFRRLQHILGLLNAHPQYICASATIADPAQHLLNLFGVDFSLVGAEYDTSPKHPVQVHLLNPLTGGDLLSSVADLLRSLAREGDSRFITFMDSRKQVEHVTSILARPSDLEPEDESYQDHDREDFVESEHLDRLHVLPFRAGYESRDRDAIQSRLSHGKLRGIVSTSALELGMDIPYLSVAVLVGVPHSATSLWQRIGRIGRHSTGVVYVLNTGDVYDQAVYSDPASLLKRPLGESALYLENIRIQYIHALCLARQGGEHDQVTGALKLPSSDQFRSEAAWPEGFLSLCSSERVGTIPVDLQSMKLEAGDDPNHTFPLRDVGSQFSVQLKQGPEVNRLGSLSYSQLMREAYPGAIYYYITQPYRVYNVYVNNKTVLVRKEKRYTTRPQYVSTQVFPNLGAGSLFRARKFGELLIIECSLQIREALNGFKERRGPNEMSVTYPLDISATGVNFKLPRFTHNYFTTGVIISHPALNREHVKRDALASLLYEAFLLKIPFERQDINFASDTFRTSQNLVSMGEMFLSIHDATYGSLRLSGRLLEGSVMHDVALAAIDVAEKQRLIDDADTTRALDDIVMSFAHEGHDVSLTTSLLDPDASDQVVRVIMPGSKGLDLYRNNEEFSVDAVYFHPGINGLAYRGRRMSNHDADAVDIVPVAHLTEIPGESALGIYSLETGELKAQKH